MTKASCLRPLQYGLLVIASFAFAVAGFCMGRYHQSSQSVVIFDRSAQRAFLRSVDTDPDWAEKARIGGDLFKQFRDMVPLVKAGPFQIHFNNSNGDFAILREGNLMAMQYTDGQNSIIQFDDKSGKYSCTYEYTIDENTVVRSTYISQRGPTGPLHYVYIDNDGDGVINQFIDFLKRRQYKLEDMKWELMDASDFK